MGLYICEEQQTIKKKTLFKDILYIESMENHVVIQTVLMQGSSVYYSENNSMIHCRRMFFNRPHRSYSCES